MQQIMCKTKLYHGINIMCGGWAYKIGAGKETDKMNRKIQYQQIQRKQMESSTHQCIVLQYYDKGKRIRS